MRTCVACGLTDDKRKLVRLVRLPQGMVSVDLSGRVAGRGAYLCRETSCWHLAMDKGRIEHSLKTTMSSEERSALLVASEDFIGIAS